MEGVRVLGPTPCRVPRRLENLENKNGHGKVIEHAKLPKSHGIASVSTFSSVLCKIEKRDGHRKVVEKYFVMSVGTLPRQV